MDLAVRVLGWSSEPLGTTIRHVGLLRSQSGGQDRRMYSRGEESPRRRDLTSGGAEAIPALQGPRLCVGTPGRFQAERRSFCGVWPGSRCGGAAETRWRGGSAPAQRVRAWRWGAEVAAVWRG